MNLTPAAFRVVGILAAHPGMDLAIRKGAARGYYIGARDIPVIFKRGFITRSIINELRRAGVLVESPAMQWPNQTRYQLQLPSGDEQ